MARKTGSHGDITGPKVHAAALRLIARHGFAVVSMRQIAHEVGVQAGALYRYTPDKQTLLFDLMRGHMDALLTARAATAGDVTGGDTPLIRLDEFVRFHIRFHLERPDAVFVSYMELRNLTPENFAALEALRRDYEDQLEVILESGVAAGEFDLTDTKITTLAIIAMLTGLTTWYREDGRLPLTQIERIYTGLVRGAVGVS
jgi:AcrR family transcriptional regulator